MNVARKDEERVLTPAFLEEIRKAREERGISIDEIAEKINIKSSYIKAIEEGNIAALPGGIYNKAYIKSVSEFLGLNMKTYQRNVESDEIIKEKEVRIELGKPLNASMPSKIVVIGCLFMIFLLYTIYYGPRVTKNEQINNTIENYKDKQTELAEDKIDKTDNKAAQEEIMSELQAKLNDSSNLIKRIPQVSPIQRETQSYISDELVITLLAKNNVNVQVKDAYGKVILQRELIAEEALMLNGSEKYYLVTNNINNLDIFLDGVQIKDTSKIEKEGSTYVLKSEKLFDTAEKQTFTNQLNKKSSPGSVPTNANQSQNNAQGKSR